MIATISNKGQVTIPKSIRNLLHLKAGDKVELILESDNRVRLTPLTYPLNKLKGLVPRPQKPVTLDDMEKAIEKEAGAS